MGLSSFKKTTTNDEHIIAHRSNHIRGFRLCFKDHNVSGLQLLAEGMLKPRLKLNNIEKYFYADKTEQDKVNERQITFCQFVKMFASELSS